MPAAWLDERLAGDQALQGRRDAWEERGLLAQPGDEQQFIEQGRRAVGAAESESMRDSMRAAARRAAVAASWDVIVGQYEEALSACRYGTRRPTPAYAA